VDAADANYQKAAEDLKRMQRLSDDARSRQELEQAVATEKTARSALEDAKARLRTSETAPRAIAAAQSDAEELAARVRQAEADLAQAQKDLDDTKILAPIDGRITHKGVERGDYVQAGQALGYLVGNDRWVIANFKETQLAHMQPGQKVDVHVDAFPGTRLEGTVDSIQSGTGVRFSAFPPENATGNFVKIIQRVPVKILLTTVPDATLPIGPGMSVVPTVYTR
jgi:membrane fusion protein (multidrug efflux system)